MLSAIELSGASLLWDEHFLSSEQADLLLENLQGKLPWEQHYIRLFGRRVASPRLSVWMGDANAHYRYSGVPYQPIAWLDCLQDLRLRLQDELNERFNSVLCNLYRNQQDSMGLHADDEMELGARPVIASLSLGATRRFRIKRRDNAVASKSIELTNGSLLVMRGDTQTFWQHEVPKQKTPCGPRINLTYRLINPVS
jgi:alkylated DNA repair dioxygenase AlkB